MSENENNQTKTTEDQASEAQDLRDFGFPDPSVMEMVAVGIVNANGQPRIVLNGNVDQERAAFMLQMAAQISMENAVFSYIPGADAYFEDEGEEEGEEEGEKSESDPQD